MKKLPFDYSFFKVGLISVNKHEEWDVYRYTDDSGKEKCVILSEELQVSYAYFN